MDFWRGELTIRRLMVLVRHLPRDSETVQALSPDARWSETDYILADLIDVQTRAKPSDPRYPRPADRDKERRAADDRRDRLERQAARIAKQTGAGGG